LTKSKELRAYEKSEGLSVSRENGGGRGNRGSSKSDNKAKYKSFKCHKFGHFKRDCPEDTYYSAQVVPKEYEDAGALVVCCWEDEGEVSHLGIKCLVERCSSEETLNTQHQPGEVVGRILMVSLERRWEKYS